MKKWEMRYQVLLLSGVGVCQGLELEDRVEGGQVMQRLRQEGDLEGSFETPCLQVQLTEQLQLLQLNWLSTPC